MRPGELTIRLNQLIQIDLDAINAYSRAILGIGPGDIRDRLAQFRDDHQRHVVELSALVRSHGGVPRESRDLMGFMVEGFTAASAALGLTGVLTAMRSNEELTNRGYERAAELDLPPEVRAVVERGLADERRHRDYIAAQLRG